MKFFLASIPESLLPHPKSSIEEALSYYIRYYESIGDDINVEAFTNSQVILQMSFIDDKTALTDACDRIR
jgi:hypothetical protein